MFQSKSADMEHCTEWDLNLSMSVPKLDLECGGRFVRGRLTDEVIELVWNQNLSSLEPSA